MREHDDAPASRGDHDSDTGRCAPPPPPHAPTLPLRPDDLLPLVQRASAGAALLRDEHLQVQIDEDGRLDAKAVRPRIANLD